jgi:hypothetical protein
MSEQPILMTNSIVCGKDHAPMVQFEWGEMRFQLMPNEARDLAVRILKAAEAAESDAFILHFLEAKLEIKDPYAQSGILLTFREFREERARKDYLPR